jgi:cbb3-type cytochrome c oxidase subunit III
LKKILTLFLIVATFLFAKDYKLIEGEQIYKETCISCHGKTGNSENDMKLAVKPRKLSKSILNEEQIFNIVKEGSHYWGSKSDIMPAFKYVYEDEDLKKVAYYVFNTFVKQNNEKVQKMLAKYKTTKSAGAKKGAKIYKRNCSLCHGTEGDGNGIFVEQSKKNKDFIYPYDLRKIILNEGQIFLYAKFGGKYWGTDKNHMPPWNKKYSDEIIKSVAIYVNKNIKHHR